ncbi:prepilin-type N-terminal cleavage/methylation domain-containing protein [bacterium]|nr:prepilin-type N-terminal cleavage/methylation domain-containing protein [bacterium]
MNQRGVTTLELLMVVVIIGILTMVTMTEFFKVHNRAYVGAALSDLQVIRKAMAMHDAEWGYFPPNDANSMPDLISQLLDPMGQPYLTPPSGDNWNTFSYDAPDPSDLQADYDLTVICNDHFNTQITVHWDSRIDFLRLGP